MTNKELTDQNKELKAEIRQLRNQVKEGVVKSDTLPNVGFGITINNDGYNLVELKFDLEKKSAIINDILKKEKNTGRFTGFAKTKLVDEIIRLSKVGV